ncbi:Thioredoxin-dependent peroxiredoxin [Abeliophyllum distichum]|uniref:Thioredoxin-dependent peroxiredoxin n=1 Tax=Abeliophyllum distichum TaxID=126358 RepID=A0ABD1QGL6_9LAMI
MACTAATSTAALLSAKPKAYIFPKSVPSKAYSAQSFSVPSSFSGLRKPFVAHVSRSSHSKRRSLVVRVSELPVAGNPAPDFEAEAVFYQEFIKRDRQTQEWPSVIETFKVNHQRNGEWVNERAASDYEKMVEEREEQTQQASSSSVAVNENDVVLKVLGERRGHRRAVGRVLRGTSRSHSSTTRLRDQHSTSESNHASNE